MPATQRLVRLAGTISSCGFQSGDRFVVGHWTRSPIGPTVDVMWAAPDGTRTLLVPDEATQELVTGVYSFDRVETVAFSVEADERSLRLCAGAIELDLAAGGIPLLLPPRPLWFTRWIERPVAYAVMGVRTWGVSPTGVTEWYQARACRFIRRGHGSIDGRDLGHVARIDPPCRFGFSEPPRRPSIVVVQPTLLRPDEGLARSSNQARQPTRDAPPTQDRL